MKQNHAHAIGGLVAGVLAAFVAALGFGACANAADDCHNTRTCDPPCSVDGGNPMYGKDSGCCVQEDGGVVCVVL